MQDQETLLTEISRFDLSPYISCFLRLDKDMKKHENGNVLTPLTSLYTDEMQHSNTSQRQNGSY